MSQKIFSHKNLGYFLSGLILSAQVAAYDFSGTYIGNTKNGIIKLKIQDNQLQDVFVRCAQPECEQTGSAKTLLLNNQTALVSELKPFGDAKSSIAYTTLVLTPTNNAKQIQAVLVGYRHYANPREMDLKTNVEFSLTEILSKLD